MLRKNLCCTILPEYYAIDSDDIVYFFLPQKPQLRVISLYKKGIYLSKATRDFIDLASSYLTRLKQK
ncbi:hypothetical protein [Clostridium diolis]|uniref:hypothetical protein n=1 Tax=Clostridium diolis TaxID=223919 RepID=UPI0015C60729|nr:hypothetical protein [Clostridium diolis]